ncbi:hypothetical protein SDRG_08121 [Saprolegnia diclina VS20]|uniref:Uncharacterized protein n=1 Tax=Saprolegnia diclina (strain VS20) TaxID=1156394 RepID=T0Q8X7_SAPDV|nr:hypothetical protein SDRG_08121 [Saprolegnia diclina VS20]EQC34349.1 hypothetical protein SDRG_08121 [Saprolegnia diclina VS20]|eukprot:XP_008612211.1 hypothetical protein SDRG_08121 [Saprolegnia diclina VS20]
MLVWPDSDHCGQLRSPRRHRLRGFSGFAYATTCIAITFVFGYWTQSYLEADAFWPGWQSMHTALPLSGIVRGRLLLDPSWPSLDLTALALAPSDAMGTPPAYPRRLMYQDLTSLHAAVVGLRALHTSHLSTMVSAYCWADLDRRWALGHTAARQMRCESHYASNAAVYLEAILRNVDVATWNDVARFQGMIGDPIASSSADGLAWVASLDDVPRRSIDDEVGVWQQHGCTSFTLQWANRLQIGLHDTVLLRSALGIDQPLVLHALPSTALGMAWVSSYLTSCLDNAFSAAYNRSLVRNTSNFFGHKEPSLIEEFNVGTPLSPIFQVVHNVIGPLGAIDLYWVPVPPPLIAAIELFRLLVRTSPVAASLTLHPTPRRWASPALRFVSGNPMCIQGTPVPLVIESFGFDDGCAGAAPLTVVIHGLSGLFGLWLLQDAETIDEICALVPTDTACKTYLAALMPVLSSLPPPPPLTATLAAVNLTLLQFIDTASVNTTSAELQLEAQTLLEPSWAFFGWTMIYDWAHLSREAVSFQGDVRTINALSAAYAPVIALEATTTLPTWVRFLRIANVLFSLGLALVGGVALAFLCCQPHAARWHLFPRIATGVWFNRGLLSLRSLTAVVCLSTAPIFPVADAPTQSTRLVFEPRNLATSCVLAIEATWVLYSVHDVMHPVCGRHTNTRAAIACAIAFLAVACLDVISPVQVAASLNRVCSSVDMDTMLYCTSGVITIGHMSRCLVLGLILVLSVCLAHLVPLPTTIKPSHTPSLALPLALVSDVQDHSDRKVVSLDRATAAMSGIFQLRRRTIFDSKLWRPIPSPALDTFVSLPDCGTAPLRGPTLQPKMSRCARFEQVSVALGGLGFLVTSLLSNVLYAQKASSYLANDYGWAGFNTTGARVFVANVVNEALLSMRACSDFALDSPSIGTINQRYNGSATDITWAASMARRQLYQPETSLVDIISGLRAMSPCNLPAMFTQYCYLDFGQTWEMASTTKRQARCVLQRSNGALFLESALRNLNDWGVWERCWGDAFAIGITAPLTTTLDGQAWLQQVRSAYAFSVDDEAAYWQRHGIESFVLQWQNFKTLGMVDTMVVTSALGLSSSLYLSTSRSKLHWQQQTSAKMYWSFASDLWAITSNTTAVRGRTLLRHSADFAFSNVTSESLLQSNMTLPTPLTQGLAIVRDAISPFNAVDMIYVPCPAALQRVYRDATTSLASVLVTNEAAQAAFVPLLTAEFTDMLPIPSSALASTSRTVGGNLLCGDDFPPYLLSLGFGCFFGPDNMCHAYFSEYISLDMTHTLVALLATQDPTLDGDAICYNDALAHPDCPTLYTSASLFLATFVPSLDPPSDAALDAVQALDVELVQFVAVDENRSLPLQLYRHPLVLPSDRPWRFYTWVYLVQWAAGARDVVSFQGDNGRITTLSTQSRPLTMSPDVNDIPNSVSRFFLLAVQYVTMVLISVALIATLVALRHFPITNGLNLMELNRVVGHVWIGRSWLLARSISAQWLLHTSTLRLDQVGIGTRFVSPPLDWFTTMLAGGESTWFVYILNDLLSCVSRQWTFAYAFKSALVAWSATSLWVTLVPATYTATVHRQCTLVEMDLALTCVSAHVQIGDATRVGVGFALGLAAVLLCLGIERYRLRDLPPLTVTSTTLLNATSLHMLMTTPDGLLDPASGILAGLFTVRVGDTLHIFDVKCWRHVVVTVDSLAPALIPLRDV